MFGLIFLNSLITISALQSRIYNGNVLNPEEHGYLVKLDIDCTYHCSGSIIGASWVLSSAHCFSFIPNLIIVSQKAATGRKRCLATVNSDQIIIHPEYVHHDDSITNRQNDIALLKTTKEMSLNGNTWPIALGKISPSIGQLAAIAGYGLNEAKVLLPREATVHISQCPDVVEHLLCTFDKARAGDADSGGALTWHGTLAGVISASCQHADRVEVGNCTTAYANVAAHYVWITSVVSEK